MKLDFTETVYYIRLSSSFGDIILLWKEVGQGPGVVYISLPNEQERVGAAIRGAGSRASPHSCPAIDALSRQIADFLAGEAVTFDLGLLTLDRCSDFQRRVLLAEAGIPRGMVSTYGRIASHLGVPGGARAVGGALARNPFPIVIPCHRAVRSDGALGGFRGGLAMKRALLEMEGVKITSGDRVETDAFYYGS